VESVQFLSHEFIGLVNKFFDVLNVNNFHEGECTRNVFKDPIRPGDHRMKVSCLRIFWMDFYLAAME
jgi:hypothetical protein